GDLPVLDEVLVEQADIDHHAESHEGIASGLELDQEVDVEPAVATPADPPDEIALAAAELGSYEAAGDSLESGKIETFNPVLANEAAQEIGNHLGMREEPLVSLIVLRHPPLLSECL